MTTLRIYGSILDESETYIDAEITDVDLDGNVHLSATDSTDRTWTLPLETVNNLRDKHLAARHSDISHVSHDVWTQLEGVSTDLSTEPFASAEMDVSERLEDIFASVMAIMTGDA